MIEKLKEHDIIDPKTDKVIGKIGCDLREIMDKLNEVIDVVNELQTQVAILEEHAHPTAKTEPADPYEKQRKWIGKLCKFWDDEDEGYIYEILIDIENDGSDYPYKTADVDSKHWTMSYKHCEPVPEDLIYKGGDNE